MAQKSTKPSINKDGESLETKYPELLKEWDFEKNLDFLPSQVTPYSGKKVWWKCSKSHEWKIDIYSRTRKGSNCPYCSGRFAIVGVDDLLTTNPNLKKFWHTTKNEEPITNFKAGSGRSAWWKCEKEHEWNEVVRQMVERGNCPFCSETRLLKGFNDFETKHPLIAKSWDFEKNENKPSEILSNYGKKVWWKCKEGHSYDSFIASQLTGYICPYCSNKKLLPGYNDLVTLNPEIAKEWHPTKNKPLEPEMVLPGYTEKVWWLCEKGHDWHASVYQRTRVHTGCPTCAKEMRTSFPEQAVFFYVKKYFPGAVNSYRDKVRGISEFDIFIAESNIAIEYDGALWHQDKERDQRKDAVACQHGISLYRIVENTQIDSLWFIKNRIEYNPKNKKDLERAINFLLVRCLKQTPSSDFVDIERDRKNILEQYVVNKKEKSLAELQPELIKEWHPTQNGLLKPEMFSAQSNQKVWWLCSKCDYEWETAINHRTNGTGCPKCADEARRAQALIAEKENSLGFNYPELLKSWHPTKNVNIDPWTVHCCSVKDYWWRCDNGHDFQASADERTHQNTECPYCSNRALLVGYNDLATSHPRLAREWHPTLNGALKPTDVIGGKKKVWWLCEKNHPYEASIDNRKNGRGCPVCAGKKIVIGFNDLTTTHPNVAKEWHPTLNVGISVFEVSKGSNKKVWWKCSICEYEWEAQINNRTKGRGCPRCAGKIHS